MSRLRLQAAAAALVLAASVPAWAQGLPGTSDGQPVNVDADNAIEWHQDVRAYVARGNASAVRGTTTVKADVLTAYYREVPGKGSEIFQLAGDGQVHIINPDQEVFGDHAIYDADKKVLVVTGQNLRLQTKTDVVTARDALEYYEGQGFSVARGDALAVRSNGDRLRADVLIGQFEKDETGSSKMKRIDGSGNVVVTTATDVARSEKVVYSVADNTAVLIGNVRITRGDNQINGEAAEMNMNTHVNRVIAGAETGGRVKGLLIPGSQSPADGPPAAAAAPR